jgi:hypothetical protein
MTEYVQVKEIRQSKKMLLHTKQLRMFKLQEVPVLAHC